MTTARENMIREYYAKGDSVKVTIPPTISKTYKGNVVTRFNGKRCGYDFKDGVAMVKREDLHKFRKYKPAIIEGEENTTNQEDTVNE